MGLPLFIIMSAVESVCPPPEELEVKGVAVCPVEGCEREFPSSSHLQMHVARHHEGRKLRGRGGKRLAFYCPVEECERREGGGKPFPRLGELKQIMHGSREFVCRRCGKRFRLGDACRRHEAECGQTFTCGTCAEEFRSRNALYQHTKRKHRTLPPSTRSKPTKPDSGCAPLLVVPLILKQVVQLPREGSSSSHKPRAVDAAVQTEPEAIDSVQVVLLGPASTESELDKVEKTLSTVAEPVPPISPTLRLDHSDFSDLATQTDFGAQLLSFSTQTMSLTTSQGSQTQPFASCELSTQTYQDPIAQHNDQFSLGTQTQQDFTQSSLGTQTQRNHDQFSLGTQTQQNHAQFSLGTQTQQNHAQFSLGTQTQQNHAQFSLGTQTREDHAQFTLGTQTQCDLTQFSLGTQTQQDLTQFSLCDFGTQTMDGLSLVEQVLGTSLLPPECLDFGTQTRESSLDEMVCLDFRALLHNRTREQGSQT